MNDLLKESNFLELQHFKNAVGNSDYETARAMLDGKYKEIFKAYQDVAQEMKALYRLEVKSAKDLERLSLNEKGLRLMICLLELATNHGIMLTNAQLNNQEEK